MINFCPEKKNRGRLDYFHYDLSLDSDNLLFAR